MYPLIFAYIDIFAQQGVSLLCLGASFIAGSKTENMIKYLMLLLVNVLLLIMGMFLEGGAALIILAPLMGPLVKAAGIDLVHFGIVVNVNIMIGGLTPPFGSMMFTCVSITGCKMGEFIREVQPFILALIIALLLLTYIPGISLLLPNLIY